MTIIRFNAFGFAIYGELEFVLEDHLHNASVLLLPISIIFKIRTIQEPK